jgi:hypothetical protein
MLQRRWHHCLEIDSVPAVDNARASALVAEKFFSATSGRQFQTNRPKAHQENCDDNNAAVRRAGFKRPLDANDAATIG